jgi:predicted ATP-grasp superfamily ATP-dependent carboligase
MKRVLVLDANQRSALAVTRSLGSHGVTVITADETPFSLASSSKFSSSYFSYPSPRIDPRRFIDFLAEEVNRRQIEILLPMTELTTTLLLNNNLLFPHSIIPFPEMDVVNKLADKCSLIGIARELNIPVPRSWEVEKFDQLPFQLSDLSYPVVLKPGKSWLQNDNKWSRNNVRFGNNPKETQAIIDSDPAFHSHPFLVQEYITGYGQGIFAIYDQGKPLAFFAHRRLREKPPSGGVSVLSQSIPVNPDTLSYARALMDSVNWHGVAMIEFKVSENGTPYLMEVNTRFWGSLQLAIDAGVDFPWLLYQIACGAIPEAIQSYRTGIRLRWLLGDLDNLYLTLRDRQLSLKTKFSAILQFLTPHPLKTRHEVNRWQDPGPFWFELKKYVRDILH